MLAKKIIKLLADKKRVQLNVNFECFCSSPPSVWAVSVCFSSENHALVMRSAICLYSRGDATLSRGGGTLLSLQGDSLGEALLSAWGRYFKKN